MNFSIYELIDLNDNSTGILKDWFIPLISAFFGGVCTYLFDYRKNQREIKLTSLRNAEYIRMVLGFQKASIQGLKDKFETIADNDFTHSLCCPIITTINQGIIEKLLAYKEFSVGKNYFLLIPKKINFIIKKLIDYGFYVNNLKDFFHFIRHPICFKKQVIYIFKNESGQLNYCMNSSSTSLEEMPENIKEKIKKLIFDNLKEIKDTECIRQIYLVINKCHIISNSEVISFLHISEISYKQCFMAVEGYNDFLEKKFTSELKEVGQVPRQIFLEKMDHVNLIKKSLKSFTENNQKATIKFEDLCVKVFKNKYLKSIEILSSNK